MKTTQPTFSITRRNFLKLAAVGSAAVVGGHLFDTYQPWAAYEEKRIHPASAPARDLPVSQIMQSLLYAATLAASGHNTQPWKFTAKENEIQIHPDFTRHLAVVDPQDREMWISLGCALENLLIAARAAGYLAEVAYPDTGEVIRVRLSAASAQKNPLFEAIPLRQNTRSVYSGQPLNSGELEKLQSMAVEPGVMLKFCSTPEQINLLRDYIQRGNQSQFSDRSFTAELMRWLRFNKKEALATRDGLYSRCSGNMEVPRWLGEMFVSGMKPEQQTEGDIQKLLSSAGAVILASQTDEPSAWVRTGQVYERLALTMTSLNIKSAFLNQPVEVVELRQPFAQALALDGYWPQLVVRYGYADAMPISPRRPLEAVVQAS